MSFTRDLVAIGAAARLTRLVTRDWLGEWTIVRPVRNWAERHEGTRLVEHLDPEAPVTEAWRHKLAHGLDCPHCVGFWLTLGTLGVSRLPLPGLAAKARDLALDALAGSYVVGHVSSRIDL